MSHRPTVFTSIAAFLLAVLAGGVISASGCGGISASSLCGDVCDCQGCSDEELDDCIDDVEDGEKSAADEGCEEQFEAYFDCVDSELECKSGAVSVDGCEAEEEAVTDCGAVLKGLGNPCERAAEICGASGGSGGECSGAARCLATCIISAGLCDSETIIACSESSSC